MNSKLQQAFNVVVKYGFCGDCRWNFESSNCVKHDCYENCVSVIQDALDSIDAEPVVRCKECVYSVSENEDFYKDVIFCSHHGKRFYENYYCSNGEHI